MMSKMNLWDSNSIEKDVKVKELNARIDQLEGLNKILLKRTRTLTDEIKDLRSDIKEKDECLEAFKSRESKQAECSKTSEMASQQAETICQQAEKITVLEKEVKDLRQGMGSFVQGEESLKSLMKNTNVPLVREGVGLNFNKKDKVLKYEGRNGVPYKYAMPWRTCNKCGGKGHLEKNCTAKVHNEKKTAYRNGKVG